MPVTATARAVGDPAAWLSESERKVGVRLEAQRPRDQWPPLSCTRLHELPTSRIRVTTLVAWRDPSPDARPSPDSDTRTGPPRVRYGTACYSPTCPASHPLLVASHTDWTALTCRPKRARLRDGRPASRVPALIRSTFEGKIKDVCIHFIHSYIHMHAVYIVYTLHE